jgi:hypothetical protein
MRASTTLLALCFVLTRVHAGEGIFDPDPQHPWNRLEAALTTDERVPDFPGNDAKERFERWLFRDRGTRWRWPSSMRSWSRNPRA